MSPLKSRWQWSEALQKDFDLLRFFRVPVLAFLILCMTQAGAVEANSSTCVSSAEKQALDTRVLLTELMIAGLSCGLSSQYNTFVTQYRPQLREQGATLTALFNRLHGQNAPRRLHTFVTNLANDASQRSHLIGHGYCPFVANIFADASGTSSGNLQRLTVRPWIPLRHRYQTCGSS